MIAVFPHRKTTKNSGRFAAFFAPSSARDPCCRVHEWSSGEGPSDLDQRKANEPKFDTCIRSLSQPMASRPRWKLMPVDSHAKQEQRSLGRFPAVAKARCRPPCNATFPGVRWRTPGKARPWQSLIARPPTRTCRILVTGADGFIGSHVTELPLREAHRVSCAGALQRSQRYGAPATHAQSLSASLEVRGGDITDLTWSQMAYPTRSR